MSTSAPTAVRTIDLPFGEHPGPRSGHMDMAEDPSRRQNEIAALRLGLDLGMTPRPHELLCAGIGDTGGAMSRSNVAAAKRIYEARNRGDVDAVLAEFDPDVTWHPHLATLGGNPIRGHDGVRAYMHSLQEDWVGFRHEPEKFIDAGDKVVAFLHTYARGRGSGVNVEVPVAHVLTFKAGKCMGYVSYHDRAEALRAAGLSDE